MKTTIRLLLVDDHLVFLDGLSSLFAMENDLEVIGCATTGTEALAIVNSNAPDVVILDVNMKVSSEENDARKTGIDLIDPIREMAPNVAIVMLTMHNEGEFIRTAIEKKVEAYVLKDAPGSELITAIRKARKGELFYSQQVTQTVIEGLRAEMVAPPAVSLTKREVETIRLISEGNSTPEIAEKLFISENTVKSHRKNIYQKSGVKNVAELIRFARENYLLD